MKNLGKIRHIDKQLKDLSIVGDEAKGIRLEALEAMDILNTQELTELIEDHIEVGTYRNKPV